MSASRFISREAIENNNQSEEEEEEEEEEETHQREGYESENENDNFDIEEVFHRQPSPIIPTNINNHLPKSNIILMDSKIKIIYFLFYRRLYKAS